MIFVNALGKYEVAEKDGDALVCNDTNDWIAGAYTYQLQTANGVCEQGQFIVLQNFALADSTDYLSKWRAILEAVDAVIAGRATAAQQEVRVGDKTLRYLSISELLQYREFVLGKVAEEEEAQGENTPNPSDGEIFTIRWRDL